MNKICVFPSVSIYHEHLLLEHPVHTHILRLNLSFVDR